MSAFDPTLGVVASALAATFGGLILLRKERNVSSWNFLGGMLLLSAGSFFDSRLLSSVDIQEANYWQRLSLMFSLPAPAVWLAFSLTYSRGDPWGFLKRWRYALAGSTLLPIGMALWSGLPVELRPLESGAGWWLPLGGALGAINLFGLGVYVLALSNLEKTLRAAAGTVQWRIKFAVLGFAVILAARIYTATQALLYSGRSTELIVAESLALIVGCGLLAVAYARRGFADLDVYPSRAVLQSSVTVLLVGGYLVMVGVLAQALGYLGKSNAFRAQAFLVLMATVLLGALLLSGRLRLRIRQAITRHFHRPVHDYRAVWTRLTQSLSAAFDQRQLSQGVARLLAGTFDVLSVEVWIADPAKHSLYLGASTAGDVSVARSSPDSRVPIPAFDAVRTSRPVSLGETAPPWAEGLQKLGISQFATGGIPICLPLIANGEVMGVIVLADRVDGHSYELDEFDLLQGIGDQVAAAILHLRMTAELMQSKELEAFQTMSAFFVHDLKNAASSLSLTLENLPVHFGDPDFRSDALRGIERTVGRIHQLIARLSSLRDRLEINPTEVDLNELVIQAFEQLGPEDIACVSHELAPLPRVNADPEQLQSVINNLLFNARDAVQKSGHIRVETCARDGRAILLIEDDGCGMSDQFVQNSLFRPFQSTKKNGLGIGMFQARQIIKAHRGSIDVETAVGHGTRFLVSLPVASS